jgi:hypothetical protein
VNFGDDGGIVPVRGIAQRFLDFSLEDIYYWYNLLIQHAGVLFESSEHHDLGQFFGVLGYF